MKTSRKIVCNARILGSELTGVQRYTHEVLSRLPNVPALMPPKGLRRPFNLVWEQLALPWLSCGKLLWSPANVGPLLVRNQVVTVHDVATVEFPADFSGLFQKYYRWLLPRLLPRARAVITVSEYTRRRVLHHFNLAPEKVHAIPLGVDHQRFYPRPAGQVEALRKKLNLPKRYVLYVGSITGRKNVGRLITAWKKAQTQLPECELLIAGGGGATHVFNGSQLPQLPPRTRLLGRVEDADLPALLSGASLFTFVSLYEGFGLPPLEAMACGTPCLVSNVTSLPEVVGSAALTVNPEDENAIAAAMVKVLSNAKLAKELSRKGRQRASQFTWEETARQTLKVLQSCA